MNNGRVLLVNQHGNSWSLPKGHVDPGETSLDAAKREIYEESGISKLKLIEPLGTYERHRIALNGHGEDTSELKTIELFLFQTDEEALKPVDAHNPEARWVLPEEVCNFLTHQKDKDFFLLVLPKLAKMKNN